MSGRDNSVAGGPSCFKVKSPESARARDKKEFFQTRRKDARLRRGKKVSRSAAFSSPCAFPRLWRANLHASVSLWPLIEGCCVVELRKKKIIYLQLSLFVEFKFSLGKRRISVVLINVNECWRCFIEFFLFILVYVNGYLFTLIRG